MGTAETEALVAALEACAFALEQHEARGAAAPERGSLPRLRPPSGIPGASASGWFAPPAQLDASDAAVQELRDLAAEFRDVAREVEAGQAGRGWVSSLVGRASRFLDEDMLANVQAAARGYF